MKSTEPDNHSNLLIAVALSTIVIMAWQYFYISPKLEKQREQARFEQQDKAAKISVAPPTRSSEIEAPDGPSSRLSTSTESAPDLTRKAAIAASDRIPIDTPSLIGSIALKGALIDDLTLRKYTVTSDSKSDKVTLFSPPGAPDAYFAEHGWKPSKTGVKTPTSDTLWSAKDGATKLTTTSPVTLTWNNGAGLVFKRTISVDDNYLFTIESTIENTSGAAVILNPYARIYRFGTPKVEGFVILHEGLLGVPGDSGLQEITFAEALEDGSRTLEARSQPNDDGLDPVGDPKHPGAERHVVVPTPGMRPSREVRHRDCDSEQRQPLQGSA